MTKWITCGSFNDPKKSREYIRFYSKLDHNSKEEAELEASRWIQEKRYAYIWIEEVKK